MQLKAFLGSKDVFALLLVCLDKRSVKYFGTSQLATGGDMHLRSPLALI